MKFLCLLGGYCSAKGSTEHVPSEFAWFFGLPPNYTFIKVDGPELVDASMGDFPNRNTPEEAIKAATTAVGDPTFSCIAEFMDQLVCILDSEDDIDGVIGFSEGAQVAASLILEEQRRERELVTGKLVTADDYNEEPITIPTCHVADASDPFLEGSMALYNMCDPDSADPFDHGAGHLIPRQNQTADEIALVVRKMINCVALFV
ncbi:hypothetical protein N7471_002729 [Penicillium samsonianum]|uniref:uncharacterized protein n=1 Tax=Penicillium samsonianum TaxID=1882272 RepID=UPI0025482BA2|nr:uncharacterized protein N7471_002729 [Penicillium samsonianum]KAJ6143276.1 hypothetical protein N7471_002729 [Penicillium samsonianum]